MTEIHIEDANGKPLFNRLIDDGTNVLRFISGFGFVTREEVIRQHWIIKEGA